VRIVATSQNGWPVAGRDQVVDRAILGVEFPNGWLRGDVDVIFTYLVGRLHREVEPMMSPGCWGWHVKRIEGSDDYSNHASGTAFDYNAPRHPMGRRNTYSEADRSKIRAILDDLDGVIRWGGDYVNRPDDMHFEVHATRQRVSAVADRIRNQAPTKEAEDVSFVEQSFPLTNATADALRLARGQSATGAGLLQTIGIRLGEFTLAEAQRDAQTAAILAGMNTALQAVATASGVLTPTQLQALTEQVRQAASEAAELATAELAAKLDSLRDHLGDDE
jgi:hypothetical protein